MRSKCPYDGCLRKPFGFVADLNRHIQAKHSAGVDEATVKCLVFGCMEVFSRKDNMRRHMRKKHSAIVLQEFRIS
jgi:hypothetical protein